MNTRFEACISKVEARPDDLMPRYSVLVYKYIDAGVCGPCTDEAEAVGMGGVISQLTEWGFEMTDFPTPGTFFATAPLQMV